MFVCVPFSKLLLMADVLARRFRIGRMADVLASRHLIPTLRWVVHKLFPGVDRVTRMKQT